MSGSQVCGAPCPGKCQQSSAGLPPARSAQLHRTCALACRACIHSAVALRWKRDIKTIRTSQDCLMPVTVLVLHAGMPAAETGWGLATAHIV
jgi:hypothetical protein